MGRLSFTIGTPPEELKQASDMYRDGLTRAKPVGKFVNGRAATSDGAVAPTRERRGPPPPSRSSWYARKGTEAVAFVSKWMREMGQGSGTYAYGDALADLDTEFLNFDFSSPSGACSWAIPPRASRRRHATSRRVRPVLCLVKPLQNPAQAVMRDDRADGEARDPAVTR